MLQQRIPLPFERLIGYFLDELLLNGGVDVRLPQRCFEVVYLSLDFEVIT